MNPFLLAQAEKKKECEQVSKGWPSTSHSSLAIKGSNDKSKPKQNLKEIPHVCHRGHRVRGISPLLKMPCTAASSQAFGRQEGHYGTGWPFSKREALDAGVCRQTLLAWSSNTFWRRDIFISEFLQQYSVLSILKPPVLYESGAGWRFLLLYLKYNAKASMPSISACIWTWSTR